MAGSRSTTRILIELSDFSSLTIEKNIRKIGKLVGEHAPGATGHFFSGSTYQMAMMNQYVTRGLLKSVATAFAIICILMIVVFRCVRLGIIAMVPNIFPVLMAGGIMGFCGMPLEFVTMTVAPMIMGLAVDDTIHLLSHLRSDIEESGDFTRGLAHTFSVVGSAVTETSLILCLSFIVLAVSRVASIATMGLIACAGIFAAYLSDIFVTPILMKKFKYSSWGSPG
jgi:predicted RND superfamily exporter protein